MRLDVVALKKMNAAVVVEGVIVASVGEEKHS